MAAADLRLEIAALCQPGREQAFLDVAVAVAVGPVAEIAIAQFVAEQGDDAILRRRSGWPMSLISIESSR